VTVGPTVTIRRLRGSDAEAVLAAVTSAPDMSRQGDMTTLEDAER
jgi:hypothetical protein